MNKAVAGSYDKTYKPSQGPVYKPYVSPPITATPRQDERIPPQNIIDLYKLLRQDHSKEEAARMSGLDQYAR